MKENMMSLVKYAKAKTLKRSNVFNCIYFCFEPMDLVF